MSALASLSSGKERKQQKKRKKESFLHLSVWHSSASSSAGCSTQLATGFFLTASHWEVLQAELNQTGLRRLLQGWQTSHQSQPCWKLLHMLFSLFSQTFAWELICSPCIHIPPKKNGASPPSDNPISFIQRSLNKHFPPPPNINSGTSQEENSRQGLTAPGHISGYENSSLVKIRTAKY